MKYFNLPLALAGAFAAALTLAVPAGADDLFTVGPIHVDASAQSALVAQGAAVAQGRPKAWSTLYRRIVKQQDWGRQPRLDDAALQRIIRTFTVKNERRSTTRYVADVTYTFSPEGVARVMQGVGVSFTQVAGQKRILLLPFSPGYSRTSAWAAALSAPRATPGAMPLSLPSVGDDFAGFTFDSVNWNDVAAAAGRVHATEAVAVMVAPGSGRLTITLKRLGQGQLSAKTNFDVPLVPSGAPATYPSASDAALRGIEEMWKHPPDAGQAGHLTADVRIASLAQWASLQNQMATVPNVSAVSVIAMDIGEAKISLAYIGTTDQLKDALGAQGIALTNHGGEWTLSSAGTP